MGAKTFIIQSESMGRGDEELGKVLTTNFLRILGESENRPSTIFLLNSGVKLACTGSAVLGHLKKLDQQGVEIFACSTCLDYFELKDKIVVGKPSTMGKAIQLMMNSETICL